MKPAIAFVNQHDIHGIERKQATDVRAGCGQQLVLEGFAADPGLHADQADADLERIVDPTAQRFLVIKIGCRWRHRHARWLAHPFSPSRMAMCSATFWRSEERRVGKEGVRT